MTEGELIASVKRRIVGSDTDPSISAMAEALIAATIPLVYRCEDDQDFENAVVLAIYEFYLRLGDRLG